MTPSGDHDYSNAPTMEVFNAAASRRITAEEAATILQRHAEEERRWPNIASLIAHGLMLLAVLAMLAMR